jgi:hypothetical protein
MSLRQTDRFQTMEAFLGELEKYEGGRPGFLLPAAAGLLVLLLAAAGIRAGILPVPDLRPPRPTAEMPETPEAADSGSGRTFPGTEPDRAAAGAEDIPSGIAGTESAEDIPSVTAGTEDAGMLVSGIPDAEKPEAETEAAEPDNVRETVMNAEEALTGWTRQMENAGDIPAFGRTVPESMPVGDLAGTVTLASAYDSAVMVSVSQDPSLEEPELIVWTRVWDETQQFRFVLQTDAETGYRIYPVWRQADGEDAKCLEYNRDTGQVLVRQESDSPGQLFRVIRARQDRFLLQASDGGVLGYSLHPDGTADGCGIRVRTYEEFSDPSFAEWTVEAVPPE